MCRMERAYIESPEIKKSPNKRKHDKTSVENVTTYRVTETENFRNSVLQFLDDFHYIKNLCNQYVSVSRGCVKKISITYTYLLSLSIKYNSNSDVHHQSH